MNKEEDMKSNKLFNVAGSKERLFEMMQKVNKVTLHEGFDSSNDVYTYLDSAWGDLQSHRIKIDETNTQAEGNESYVEIIATDQAGTKCRFSFKVQAQQGDQDGVWDIVNAELFQFTMGYGNEHGISVDSDSQAVKNFNARQQQSAIIDVVSEYADFESGEPEAEAELDEEYWNAAKKIDSYPFGGTPRTMVSSPQYGDQKPTNPALRVKAPELNKFVDETTTSNQPDKFDIIEHAIEIVGQKLAQLGLTSTDIPHEKYLQMIKQECPANMGEGKKKKRDGGDYPNPIGSHFKPKSDYPSEKKKPQTAVNIDEEFGGEEKAPNMGLRDTKPNLKMAKSAANADMDKEHRGANKVPYDTQFGEFDLREGEFGVGSNDTGEEAIENSFNDLMKTKDFVHLANAYADLITLGSNIRTLKEIQTALVGVRGTIANYLAQQGVSATAEDVQNYFENRYALNEGAEPNAGEEQEINHIEKDREETGEKLEGGLGDDATPEEFDQEQVLMGLKVEMEHSDDPTVALEIVLDHLSEDPEYYTTKDDPEASAQANAAKDAEEFGCEEANPHLYSAGIEDDKEEEDILLGFKPHNVGDGIEETYGTPDPLKIPAVSKIGTVR